MNIEEKLIFCVHTPYQFVRFEVNSIEQAEERLEKLKSQKIDIWRAELYNISQRDRNGSALIGDLIVRLK